MTKKVTKKGQVSIKISKPKLTINGFVVPKKRKDSISPQKSGNGQRRVTGTFNEEKENIQENIGEIAIDEIGDPDPQAENYDE